MGDINPYILDQVFFVHMMSLIISLITYVRKSSSTYFYNPLDCLCLLCVLPANMIWFKFPVRIRDCEYPVVWRPHQHFLTEQVLYSRHPLHCPTHWSACQSLTISSQLANCLSLGSAPCTPTTFSCKRWLFFLPSWPPQYNPTLSDLSVPKGCGITWSILNYPPWSPDSSPEMHWFPVYSV